MAEKLKIISLGGLNEIGKNLTVYEYKEDILVVDCGLGFPDDDMYGIDVVIPDVTYLQKNRNRIRGIFITHGHEDHIGAIPYVIGELNVPIYATRFTAALIKLKLAEWRLEASTEIKEITAGQSYTAGCFRIEPIHINHSIADAVSFAIRTPVGTIIHTGDFKIDTTPIQGEMADLTRFGEYGKKGVLALLADSTNVEKVGYSVSESRVGIGLENYFNNCDRRIIITTFASNIHRMQQVIDCAVRHGRKVSITGRSMENIMRVSKELDYVHVPEGTLVDIHQIKGLPPEKVVVVTTGSQGEEMSALYRMAFSGHRQVEITASDRVIISASAIPGNEKTIGRVINELFNKGAEVIYDKSTELHASGHACQEELKMMLALTKPKFFVPVHGEQRHLHTHAKVAQEMGIPAKNILVSDIGRVIELSTRGIKFNGTVPSGVVLVDGTGIGDVGAVVLRDRKHLAQDGMLVVVVSLSREDGSLVSGPDVITRGFVYVKESEELIRELKERTIDAIEDCSYRSYKDWSAIKSAVKSALSDYLYKTTKRNPMILPVIMEI